MSEPNIPLAELLRPQELGDLTLPDRQIERLQHMLDTQNPMNMLFYGPPGMGKTSAARIFCNARDEKWATTYWINGSLENGIQNVRSHIEGYASNYAITGGTKILIIDEADFMSLPAQASMRGVIEQYSKYCRFIFTANDILKLKPAIRSRMISISFSIDGPSKPAILARMQQRLPKKLANLGITFDRDRLNQIVACYFPDFRSIANRLEFEFIH